MFLALVIILLLIWAAVVGSIYSGFLVFYTNFWETENYNKAYYASIAALERAELVIKQREPGYEWSGGRRNADIHWFVNLVNTWNINKTKSDWKIWSGFSYFAENSNKWTNVFWAINSRTTRIPNTWDGNVDWMLSAEDSLNYNVMNYEDAEIVLLYYDRWEWNAYSWVSCTYNSPDCERANLAQIVWKIRLPAKLKAVFGDLDTKHALIWKIKNDAIVDRQMKWFYLDIPFTIYSTQNTRDANVNQIWPDDTAIREQDINQWVDLNFAEKIRPFERWWDSTKITIISPKEDIIKNDFNTNATAKRFKRIYNNTSYTNLQLRFSLLNLLKNQNWMIYPYLEYYLDFWWAEVSDRFFTINAEWRYGDYQVNLIIQKPTIKESIMWSFTTIF